jgi:hypothetical protein
MMYFVSGTLMHLCSGVDTRPIPTPKQSLWEGRAAAQAKVELLQVELNQMRAEAEGRGNGDRVMSSNAPRRRFWRLWFRRRA